MRKLNWLYKNLEQIGNQFVLWYSGGRDSRLILETSIKVGARPLLLCFDDGWSLEQRRYVYKTVRLHNLPLYSYSPWKAVPCQSDPETITVAALYSYSEDGKSFLILKDLEDDPDRCALELTWRLADRQAPPIKFLKHVVGSRKTDRHPLFGDGYRLVKQAKWTEGDTQFFAPLYDWHASEVSRALGLLGVSLKEKSPDTGNIPACSRCMVASPGEMVFCPKRSEKIPAFEWDKEHSSKTVLSWLPLE